MPKLIEVLGPSRSGTTIFHLMLANAPNAFACGEVYAFFRPFRTHHFNVVCSCGKDFESCTWKEFKSSRASEFYDKLIKRTGIRYIVDESKNLRWVTDSQKWAEKSGIDVVNILMWKEPLDMMYSYWKRNKDVRLIEKAALKYYKRFFDLGIPFISVNLSELITNPSKKLARVCEVVGMPYFIGKERYWEKKHCHLFGNLGVRKQMEKGNVRFRVDRTFPESFLEYAEPILNRMKNQPNWQRAHHLIESREVDKTGDRYQQEYSEYKRKRHYPLWYYSDILRSMIRRRFPQKWQYPQ